MAFNKKEGPNMDISVILRKGNKIIMGSRGSDVDWRGEGGLKVGRIMYG
jgi:hypothetical protein